MSSTLIGCGASACVFSPVPEICGKYDNSYVIKVPKRRELVTFGIDLSDVDPGEDLFIYNDRPCLITDDIYNSYMHNAGKEYRIKGSVMGTIQHNGGICLESIYRNKDIPDVVYYTALINVLRGIGVMNNIMIFHLDIHRRNIVVDSLGHSRIIDFDNAVDMKNVTIQQIIDIDIDMNEPLMNAASPQDKEMIRDAISSNQYIKLIPFIKKYRLYVDLCSFLYLFDGKRAPTTPAPIIDFLKELYDQKLNAIESLPLYIEAVKSINM